MPRGAEDLAPGGLQSRDLAAGRRAQGRGHDGPDGDAQDEERELGQVDDLSELGERDDEVRHRDHRERQPAAVAGPPRPGRGPPADEGGEVPGLLQRPFAQQHGAHHDAFVPLARVEAGMGQSASGVVLHLEGGGSRPFASARAANRSRSARSASGPCCTGSGRRRPVTRTSQAGTRGDTAAILVHRRSARQDRRVSYPTGRHRRALPVRGSADCRSSIPRTRGDTGS